MVKDIQYINIRIVLENLLDHPMLRGITLEQVVRWTIRFIGLHGFSKLYQDKITDVEIKEYRGMLPCDLISVVQVEDLHNGLSMRAMTDVFTPALTASLPHSTYHLQDRCYGEGTFKTQGNIIYTSFPEGAVRVAYKAIPVDEDGFPLVIDNENYLAALEAYIKKQVFTVKFDTGKISAQVLRNAQLEYGDLAAQLISEFQQPSVAEAEALSRYTTSLIPRVREFENGFKTLGNRQYIRRH